MKTYFIFFAFLASFYNFWLFGSPCLVKDCIFRAVFLVNVEGNSDFN